jgi:hypothetical protein
MKPMNKKFTLKKSVRHFSFLFLLLFIDFSVSAQFYVSEGTTYSVQKDTPFHYEGLTFIPSENWEFTNMMLTRSTTAVNYGGSSIKRVYELSSTISSFRGALSLQYEESELNGLTESLLKLFIQRDEGSWVYFDTDINDANHIGSSSSDINNAEMKRITLASSATPLPVIFKQFDVRKANQTSVLSWVTSTEINNSHFDIERSTDGNHFKTIGRVSGAGNNFSDKDYSFTDFTPLSGKNFYRLKQVDINGMFKYSITRMLDFSSINNDKTFSVYPNPTSGEIFIKFTEAAGKTLTLHSADGKLIRMIPVNNNSSSIQLNIADAKPGIYLLSNNRGESLKIIKQ